MLQLWSRLGNGTIIPGVHYGVFLVETLPKFFPYFQLIAVHGADVGELVSQRDHLHGKILLTDQVVYGFLLADQPGF